MRSKFASGDRWGTMRSKAQAYVGLLFGGLMAALASSAHAQSVEDLRNLSIGELSDIDVSSVTKTTQPLGDAPAAIYVITHDDIIRSGAQSVAPGPLITSMRSTSSGRTSCMSQ